MIQANLNINCAISLNAYCNEQRDMLMPINRKYPIEDLIKIAREYYAKIGAMVTFEYILIQGENDTDKAARALIKLLKRVPCKINLIQLNPYTASSLHPSSMKQLNRFVKMLAENDLSVTVRKSRGQDISGACGQLAGRHKTGKENNEK